MPVLKRLHQKYPHALKFKILADKSYVHPELNVESFIWSADTEVEILNSFDIGIMPLPDDEWSRGKCGLKGLSYMACGVATVMSSVGINSEIIKNGHNGLLAADEADWFKSLCQLIENKEERNRLGEAGRKTVQDFYSTAALQELYLQNFRQVCGLS